MRVRKAFCLFEQSGTFKNELKKLGIEAEDFDIPEHMEESNLMAMCAPCHLRYDAAQHAESRRKHDKSGKTKE